MSGDPREQQSNRICPDCKSRMFYFENYGEPRDGEYYCKKCPSEHDKLVSRAAELHQAMTKIGQVLCPSVPTSVTDQGARHEWGEAIAILKRLGYDPYPIKPVVHHWGGTPDDG